MALFAISYDYHNQRNYEPLYNLFEAWGAERLLESLWLANLNGDAVAVRSALMSVGDHDDSFAVIELDPAADWATTPGVYSAGVNWLKLHL